MLRIIALGCDNTKRASEVHPDDILFDYPSSQKFSWLTVCKRVLSFHRPLAALLLIAHVLYRHKVLVFAWPPWSVMKVIEACDVSSWFTWATKFKCLNTGNSTIEQRDEEAFCLHVINIPRQCELVTMPSASKDYYIVPFDAPLSGLAKWYECVMQINHILDDMDLHFTRRIFTSTRSSARRALASICKWPHATKQIESLVAQHVHQLGRSLRWTHLSQPRKSRSFTVLGGIEQSKKEEALPLGRFDETPK